MPDMVAIVSKAIYEKTAPKAKLGSVLGLRVYRSTSKQLAQLDAQSRLFLVTVRPPNEALWLVAILEHPQFDGERFVAPRNRYPLTDVSHLKSALKFASGKGLSPKKGALGMSLQTPRVLCAADVALLLQTASAAQAAAAAARCRPQGTSNLNRHDPNSSLPCLCKTCLGEAPSTIAREGGSFFRASAQMHGRILWFWVPAALQKDLPALILSVQSRMQQRLKPRPQSDS